MPAVAGRAQRLGDDPAAGGLRAHARRRHARQPPLASDIHCRDRRAAVKRSSAARMPGIFATAPLPPAHDPIRQAVALAVEAITALTAAVVLILGAALAVILAVIQGGAWLARASARASRDSI